jgi:flagellar assembly protein FliH
LSNGGFLGQFEATQPFSSLLTPLPNRIATSKDRKNLRPHEMLELAREEAHAEGYAAGFAEGAAKGYEQGHVKGFQSGYADGTARAERERQELLAEFLLELQGVRDDLQLNIDHWFRESEERMTDLSLVILRTVLHAELQISREVALELVKEALAEVTHSSQARIRINPFDLPVLAQHRDELLTASSSLRGIEFLADPSVTGGCIVETDGGVIDASTDSRLRRFADELGGAA